MGIGNGYCRFSLGFCFSTINWFKGTFSSRGGDLYKIVGDYVLMSDLHELSAQFVV
jgi:hypothetical protein